MQCGGALLRLPPSYRDGEASVEVFLTWGIRLIFLIWTFLQVSPHPLVRTVQGKARDTSRL